MKIIKTRNAFVIAAVGLLLAGCPNGPQETVDPPPETLVPPATKEIKSGDSFVGIWTVSKICALSSAGSKKRHYEVGHAGSKWGHVNEKSTYAIYKKSGSGASSVYGLMISKEFANYNDASKKSLIDWNSAELHFTAGKVHEPANGDGCILPKEKVAILQTETSGGATPKRPKLHGSTEHILQIWLYKDASGNIAPQLAFEHGSGTGPIHRGFLH